MGTVQTCGGTKHRKRGRKGSGVEKKKKKFDGSGGGTQKK